MQRPRRRRWLFLAIPLSIVACTSDGPGADAPPIRGSAEHEVAFPLHSSRFTFQARFDGRLEERDGCLKLGLDMTVVWPDTYRLVDDGGGLAIVEKGGRILAHVGERVHLGGGMLPARGFDEATFAEWGLPVRCRTPNYIIAGELEGIGGAR